MIDKKVLDYSKKMAELGIKNKILEHPSLREAEQVVRELGYTLNDSVATLIMKADDDFIAALRRDVTKISFKKIKKLLGITSLRIANPEEFAKITGLEVGTARFYIENIKTYIDEKVFEKETILGGTGSLSYTFQCLSADLKKLPQVQVADISTVVEEYATNSNLAKRVFSGIRATGRLHLGNYLGAVKGFLELEKSGEYQTIYCVVDVHTITTPYDVNELRKNKREIIIDYLAAGLDPEKSLIIYQSDIPQHTELAFYFSSVMSIARMQHLPTFKEKVKQHPHDTTMALLNYPILMAADILVYKAGLVPVGIDQEPHLEIAREVARKMNEKYGMDFPEPVRFATKGEYVPSLKGEGKMSKSVEGSYINLTDEKNIIFKKIRSIPTASISGGDLTPGLKTLFILTRLYLPQEYNDYKEKFNKGILMFSQLKDKLADAIYTDLKPFQEKRKELEDKPEYIDKVIRESAQKARTIAQKTVNEVKVKMGLS